MNRDKLKGQAKQVRGDIKEAVGDLTNDQKLRVDGKLDRVEGSVQKGYGELKESTKEAIRDIEGRSRAPGRDM
jgi:uncharacterized protein YjbJ (UPF0337 family)